MHRRDAEEPNTCRGINDLDTADRMTPATNSPKSTPPFGIHFSGPEASSRPESLLTTTLPFLSTKIAAARPLPPLSLGPETMYVLIIRFPGLCVCVVVVVVRITFLSPVNVKRASTLGYVLVPVTLTGIVLGGGGRGRGKGEGERALNSSCCKQPFLQHRGQGRAVLC